MPTADLRSTTDPEALGSLVRELRRQIGMSQEKLARAAHLSVTTIKNVERGLHAATQSTREALARVLQPAE